MVPSPRVARVARVAVITEPIRKSVYTPGEWVWCEWKKIYYKAKILECGIENDGQYYNIHYWKFSKLWDMTVSEKKMFPVMDENNKWVKSHNKLMRKEIKEAKKAREKILSPIKKGLPPTETPPYLILNHADISKYLDKPNTASSNSEVSDDKVNLDFNGTASTSREDEMTDKHSETINIDGNSHVSKYVSNTKAPATVSFNNHDDSEMKNIKCENVDPEVDINTDADDRNVKEINIFSFHEGESNIENKTSTDSQKTNEHWFEEVQADSELQSDDNSSELKHSNISVSPQCDMGSNSTENEHDRNEEDFNSTSNVKVPLHIEVEKNTYSSQNGSTEIFKRKRRDQTSAEREKKKKRRKRKHMIMNNHVDLSGENRHIIKSNKLCSMDLINNKNNDKSIDGDGLTEKSNIGKLFGNMIGPEDDSFADSEGNELSTEEGVPLQIMNTTTIPESNNENKMINIDDNSSIVGGDLKIEEDLKIEKDLKIEDVKIEEDLKLEEASTSSMTVTEANYENEMIKLVIGSPQDGDLNIEESSSLSVTVSEENDENLSISCKSTKDDGEYAESMKIMNEVKIDGYNGNFFKQFGYDKPYSRVAKQKATEAISLMSKTVNKDKKNEGCKKSKITKKKDDDEPSNIVVLTHSNLNFNCYFLQIFIQDYHLVIDDRYMPTVPSKITVFDILSAYTKHSSADLQVFTQLIHVFDFVFESLILYPIERPKHTEIVRKRPAVLMAHMYGLPHLARFIFYLPGILCTISCAQKFTTGAIHFMQGLTNYLEEQKTELSITLYENTLPEYVRSSFLPYR